MNHKHSNTQSNTISSINLRAFVPLWLKPSLLLIVLISLGSHAQENKKHRVIVLTDIEADPDDAQSLIRFLMYTNQWDVEGLIATTSIHQKKTSSSGINT
jgi:hypothetical protein